ncbi:metallophosphoesterase family protein [Homoserinimonas sp. A520]
MKVALFSDVHGNAVAFRQLLDQAPFASSAVRVFLGDAVGYFPDGAEVVSILRTTADIAVQGNHDAMIAGALPIDTSADRIYRLAAQRKSLDDSALAYLATLPLTAELGGALLVHGSPSDPLLGRIQPDTPDDEVGALPAPYVFVGQTHRPFVRQVGSSTLVNVGSVGLPRDGTRHGCYAVWDSDGGEVRLHSFLLDTRTILSEYPDVHPDVRARISEA